MRGADTSYARFRDGELLEEVVKTSRSPAQESPDSSVKELDELKLPEPMLEAPGEQELPEIPDLDLLFGSMS